MTSAIVLPQILTQENNLNITFPFFPNMKFVKIVNVLGTRRQTTNKYINMMETYGNKKICKVLQECAGIETLHSCAQVRAHIIAAKLIL